MGDDTQAPVIPLNEPQLYNRKPFDTDLLGKRKETAERLTERLQLLRNGAVICLDAPWGDGKTYFVRNWLEMLRQQDYSTIYLDAYQRDYVEEPFLVIAAAIKEQMDKSKNISSGVKERFTKSATQISRELLPTVSHVAINMLGAAVGAPGAGEAAKALMEGGAAAAEKATERVLEKRLEELSESGEDKLLNEMRNALNAYTAELDKPLVFVIDELDRCSPSFAIKLLERIKHYFECPNIVFVLSAHKAQLEEVVLGLYGNIDAAAYLNKFVHVTLHLPKRISGGYAIALDNFKIIRPMMEHLSDQHESHEAVEFIAEFATDLRMSLRDTQRAMVSLALSNVSGGPVHFCAYLSCLRIARPALYRDLKAGKAEAHHRCIELLNEFVNRSHNQFAHLLIVNHKQVLGMKPEGEAENYAAEHIRQLGFRMPFMEGTERFKVMFSLLDLEDLD